MQRGVVRTGQDVYGPSTVRGRCIAERLLPFTYPDAWPDWRAGGRKLFVDPVEK